MTREILVAQYDEERRKLNNRYKEGYAVLERQWMSKCKELDNAKRQEIIALDDTLRQKIALLGPAK